MDLELKKIVDELNNSNAKNIKMITLGTLYDFIKFAKWSDSDLNLVVQKLLDLLTEFPDKPVRDQISLNLEEALTGDHTLNVSFDSLTRTLDKNVVPSDPSFIGMVLYILSLSYRLKYIPVIKKYLSSSNVEIKERARKSIDFLEKFGT